MLITEKEFFNNPFQDVIKSLGVFTGAPPTVITDWKAAEANDWFINNSSMSDIKHFLSGSSMFGGDEIYLVFGTEVHLRVLEGKSLGECPDHPDYMKFFNLTTDHLISIGLMVKAFNADPQAVKLLRSTIREKERWRKVNGVWVRGTIDAESTTKYKIGVDLKTTSAKSEAEFIRLAVNKYDYPRQGEVYKTLRDLDDFVFIAMQKQEPYSRFYLWLSDYETACIQAQHEAAFLLEFYRQHGKLKKA